MKQAPQVSGSEGRRVPRTVELHGPDQATSLAAVLEALHRRGQRVPVHVAVYIAHELARGLRHIQQVEGRVHGAVAAENVLLLRSGRVRLIDRRVTSMPGDRHADVRDVGQLAWEMLVGWPLNEAAEQRPSRPAPLAPSLLRAGLPVAVDDLVLRALELNPQRRYPGPNALASDCARFLTTRPDPRRGLRTLLDHLMGGEVDAPADTMATRLTAVPWRDGHHATPLPPLEPLPEPPPLAGRRMPRWLRRFGLRALETTIASVVAFLALLALTRWQAAAPPVARPTPGGALVVPLGSP
jgi:hypothetical protein